jgi:hypothetical protein
LVSVAAVYIALQAGIIATAVCPARDGARYMTHALRLESEPWKDVFRTSVDHPGYPVFLAAAFAVGRVAGLDSPRDRVLAAQAATSLAGLAFVLISFAVIRRLWGTAPAWAAAVSLTTLPRPAWTFADVLSDPLHAALWMASTLAFLRALDARAPRAAILPGFLAGLAYWVRVDALVLVAAGLSTFALLALEKGSFRRSLLAGACFAASFGAALAPFVALLGRLSPKPVSEIFLLGSLPAEPERFVAAGASEIARAGWSVLSSLAQEVQAVHLVTAAIGLAAARRSLERREAVFLVAALAAGGLVFLVIAGKAGYFAGRYLLPFLPLVIGFGMAGVLRFSLLRAEGRRAAGRWVARRPGGIGLAVAVAASLAVSLPSLLGRRLHENDDGVIRAASWVAARLAGADTVHDPRFFPTYLAGIRDRAVRDVVPRGGTGRHFIIVEARDVPGMEALARAVSDGRARIAAEFPRRRDGTGGAARVYEIGDK